MNYAEDIATKHASTKPVEGVADVNPANGTSSGKELSKSGGFSFGTNAPPSSTSFSFNAANANAFGAPATSTTSSFNFGAPQAQTTPATNDAEEEETVGREEATVVLKVIFCAWCHLLCIYDMGCKLG